MKQSQHADIAYEYIKKQIGEKILYPGTRIVEADIVRNTGVSRTPVRTALTRLAYEGLLTIEPNRGAVVAKPSASDLMQVYEIRRIIEVESFKLATQRRTEEGLQLLERNLEKQQTMISKFNMVEYANVNREFHLLIATQTRNAYYEKYVSELMNKISTYLLFWDTSKGNEHSLMNHRKIYEAIRDRNYEEGIDALMDDIALAEDFIVNLQNER